MVASRRQGRVVLYELADPRIETFIREAEARIGPLLDRLSACHSDRCLSALRCTGQAVCAAFPQPRASLDRVVPVPSDKGHRAGAAKA